jgi:hypothetical protein
MTNLELITDVLTNAGWGETIICNTLCDIMYPKNIESIEESVLISIERQSEGDSPVNMETVHEWLHHALGIRAEKSLSNRDKIKDNIFEEFIQMTNVDEWMENNPVEVLD